MDQFMQDYASWVLAIIGVSGIYFVGRKSFFGWYILLFNETLWMVYAVATKQYGFIFSALAYGIVYIQSHRHWKSLDKEQLHMKNFLKIVWNRKK
jgi:hypothetical protein